MITYKCKEDHGVIVDIRKEKFRNLIDVLIEIPFRYNFPNVPQEILARIFMIRNVGNEHIHCLLGISKTL